MDTYFPAFQSYRRSETATIVLLKASFLRTLPCRLPSPAVLIGWRWRHSHVRRTRNSYWKRHDLVIALAIFLRKICCTIRTQQPNYDFKLNLSKPIHCNSKLIIFHACTQKADISRKFRQEDVTLLRPYYCLIHWFCAHPTIWKRFATSEFNS